MPTTGAQKGREFKVMTTDEVSPVTYTAIGGMRTTSLSINNEPVDVTDKDAGGWKELLGDAGVRSASISCAGVFKDSASELLVLGRSLNAAIFKYKLLFEDGSYFIGDFLVSSVEYTGDYNGARQYTMKLDSSEALVFTPAVA